jgi:hypothetical protein
MSEGVEGKVCDAYLYCKRSLSDPSVSENCNPPAIHMKTVRDEGWVRRERKQTDLRVREERKRKKKKTGK